MLYRVKVKPKYRWSMARVAGREFSKHSAVEIHPSEMIDEILTSPLLVVELPESEESPVMEEAEGEAQGDDDSG